MKERIFSAGLPLKTSLLLLGIFLVLAVAFHPTMVAAQSRKVSCYKLFGECVDQCYRYYSDSTVYGDKREVCRNGCVYFRDLCLDHQGETLITKGSAQEEMFLAEATLRLFEEAMER
jgi:hypothetical protein